MMEEILRSLGMETILGRFQAQRMDAQATLAASDQELVRLGVSTIGDRIRLRDACKSKVDENSASTSQTSAAREERLSIFHPRRHNNRNSARAAARSTTSGASKRAVKSHPWTPTFFCMADSTASKTPSAMEKQVLFKAGLGLKKIKLDLEDDEQTVTNKITSDTHDATGTAMGFPQLKTCGGFELMRCASNCRDLSVISCSWNAKDLRSALGGGQGKIYLRPIQKSLSTQPLVEQSQCEVKEKCYMCNQEILVRKLRDHLWSCTEGLDSDDDHLNSDSTATDHNPSTNNAVSAGSDLTDTALHSPPSFSDPSSASQQTPYDPSNALQQPSSNEQSNLQHTPSDLPSTSQQTSHNTPNASQRRSSELPNTLHQSSPDPPNASQSSSETLNIPTVDLTQTEENILSGQTVDEVVGNTVAFCEENSISSHVEILRCFQQKMVIGRALEVQNVAQATEGETNYINVDRNNLIQTSFEEIAFLGEYRRTLQVQFYGEVAEDYGGPRKEFFRLILGEIKETYFDNGLRELLRETYTIIGIILGLSIIQNGKIPVFLGEDIVKKVFSETSSEACIAELQEGFKKVGIYQLGCLLPTFLEIFKRPPYTLTVRSLVSLLNPRFSEQGSNRRRFENEVYAQFMKYIRLVAGGRRGVISLAHILMFATCADEEPILGFTVKPSITFAEVESIGKFVPTANTCICSLVIPHATSLIPLPEPDRLFNLFDFAFANAYFGNA